MKINRTLIKHLRLQKALSQEELAAAAGLSTRTVQRMEAEGQASLESRKAVAAIFGIGAERLLEKAETPNLGDLMKVIASSALLILATFLITSFGIAQLLAPVYQLDSRGVLVCAWGVAGIAFAVLAIRELHIINSQLRRVPA